MQTMNACEVEQAKEMGVFKRIINIFMEPSKVFKSVAQKPKVLIPIVFIILGFILLAVPKVSLMEEYTRQTYEKLYGSEQFMKTQKITKEQANASIEQTVGFSKIMSFVGPLFMLIMILIQTLVFFGLFKLFKGVGTFMQTFAVLTYSYLINLLGEVVRTINVIISTNVEVTNSLALLLPNDKTNYLFNFLNGLDLFGLWAFLVAALGLSIVHKVSSRKAYIWVISLCVLFVAISAAFTTLQAVNMYKQFGITL